MTEPDAGQVIGRPTLRQMLSMQPPLHHGSADAGAGHAVSDSSQVSMPLLPMRGPADYSGPLSNDCDDFWADDDFEEESSLVPRWVTPGGTALAETRREDLGPQVAVQDEPGSAQASLASMMERLLSECGGESCPAGMRAGLADCAFCGTCLSDGGTSIESRGQEVRVLPCFHSACGACLQSSLSGSAAATCPVCSEQYTKQGYNKFLPSLGSTSQADPASDVCGECVDEAPAHSYCSRCAMSLCEKCAKQHGRARATSEHTLTSAVHRATEREASWDKFACAHHGMQRYEFFCEDCNVLICCQCAREEHQSHAYKLPSKSVIARHKTEIRALAEKLDRKLREMQGFQQWLVQSTDGVEASAAKVRGDLDETFDDVGRAVDVRCAELQWRLSSHCFARRRILEGRKRQCAKALSDVWRSAKFLDTALGCGTGTDILQLSSYMPGKEQMDAWEKLSGPEADEAFHPIAVGWRSEEEPDAVLGTIRNLGRVHVVPSETISIRTHRGNYLAANGDGITNSNCQEIGQPEEFQLNFHQDGRASLRSYQGNYFSAKPNGDLHADRSKVGPWEMFHITYNKDDGTVSLKSHHGKYVCSSDEGISTADRGRVHVWERFSLVGPNKAVSGGSVGIRRMPHRPGRMRHSAATSSPVVRPVLPVIEEGDSNEGLRERSPVQGRSTRNPDSRAESLSTMAGLPLPHQLWPDTPFSDVDTGTFGLVAWPTSAGSRSPISLVEASVKVSMTPDDLHAI